MKTKKDALVEFYNLSNELAALRGENPAFGPEAFTEINISIMAERQKLYQLEDRIESTRRSIEKQQHANAIKAATEAYLNTPEGKARLADLTEARDKASSARRYAMECFFDEVDKWAQDNLGAWWHATHISPESVTVAIIGPDNKEVFASDIEITFGRHWGDDERRFEINVGTVGSFDPTCEAITSRAEFYRGLGLFLNGKIHDFKARCFSYADKVEALHKRYCALNDEIKNPMGL